MFWENFIDLCEKAGKTPTAVVLDLGLSRGSATVWKKGGIPNDITLKKIANYFNVTVQFLLRNDEKVTINGNVSGTYNVFGNSHSQMNLKNELNTQEQELLSQFRKLSEVQKAKALIYISELNEEEIK